MDRIRNTIRTIRDFPHKGIQFKDITPILRDPDVMRLTIDALIAPFRADRGAAHDGRAITAVAGMEARGFLFGAVAAVELGVGFIPVRKPGKLPWTTHSIDYELEYQNATLEIHTDAVSAGDGVLLIDDLLATGGTAAATCELIERCGAEVVACAFVIELPVLGGRRVLGDHFVHSVLSD